MQKKISFNGTGGSLLIKFIIGVILTGLTFGIYLPWFLVDLWKFVADNTRLSGTSRGAVSFSFRGTGGELLVIWLLGLLLSFITLGLYLPWFMVNMTRFICERAEGRADDGTVYRLRFLGTGGGLFVTFIVGYLLSMFTLGLYLPWFMCSIHRWYAQNTSVVEGGANMDEGVPVGVFDFVGSGGELFVTFLVGWLLTIITLGIYSFWLQASLIKFFAAGTRATVHGAPHSGAFSGTGGELCLKSIIGMILTSLTFGIYGAWFFVDLTRWQLQGLHFNEVLSIQGGRAP